MPYYATISEQKRGVFLSQGPMYLPGVDSPLNCGDQVARNYASLAYYLISIAHDLICIQDYNHCELPSSYFTVHFTYFTVRAL